MFKQVLQLIAAGSLMTGCALEDGAAFEEDLGVATSALCTDLGIADHSAPLGPGLASVNAETSDGSYGLGACPGRFVLEASQVGGRPVFLRAGAPTAPITNGTQCGQTTVRATAYIPRIKVNPFPRPPSMVWVELEGEKSVTGHWVTVQVAGQTISFCSLVNDPVTFETDGYFAVRIAARAERSGIPIRVSAEVSTF